MHFLKKGNKMRDIVRKAKAGGYYEKMTLVYDLHLDWLMDYVKGLENGKMVECGVARGGCIALCHVANPSLQIIGLDSWEPMPEITEKDDAKACKPWVGTPTSGKIEDVKTNYKRLNASDKNLTLLKGWFEDTIPENIDMFDNLDILRIDSDFYESILLCLRLLYPKLKSGGLLIMDDWNFNPKGVQAAFNEYFEEIGEDPGKMHFHKIPTFGPVWFFKK